MIEGESHSIKQSHLMQDRAWLCWQSDVCKSRSVEDASFSVMWSHSDFSGPVAKGLNSCIKISDHRMSQPRMLRLNCISNFDRTPSARNVWWICNFHTFIFTVGNTVSCILPVLLPLSWSEESVLLSPVWLHVLSPAQLPYSISWSRNNIISDH